jgi:hypothetical protein
MDGTVAVATNTDPGGASRVGPAAVATVGIPLKDNLWLVARWG